MPGPRKTTPLLQQGYGKNAGTRCDGCPAGTSMAPPCWQGDAREGAGARLGWPVGYGLATEFVPSGTTACCASLRCSYPPEGSVQSYPTTLIIMSPSNNWIRLCALSLRQLPAASLRKTATTPEGYCGIVRATTAAGRERKYLFCRSLAQMELPTFWSFPSASKVSCGKYPTASPRRQSARAKR